jgi:hypothetical protein
VRSFILLLTTLPLLATTVRAADAQEKAICEQFSQLVSAVAQERDTGESKEKQLATARQWDRADAIGHEPTQTDKILSVLTLEAVELVYRHPDMDATSLAAAARTRCSVGKDWDVHISGL